MPYTLFPHQQRAVEFMREQPYVFDLSEAGTGKTLTQIAALKERPGIDRTLVIAPKSILIPAWQNDFKKFAPEIKTVVATAKNRLEAFHSKADVVITNTDAVSWLRKQHRHTWEQFNNIIIDESDSFRHPNSQRSKAALAVTANAQYRSLLSATPSDNGVTDLWHQMMLLDRGNALGTSFYRFRHECCTPTQVGPSAAHLQWRDKPGIEAIVSAMIAPHAIRNKLAECIDIPALQEFTVPYKLSHPQQKAYDQMRKYGMAMLDSGELLEAAQRSTVMTKLRQIASGAAYVGATSALIEMERYELVVELATRVPHSIIFFEWTHQKEGLETVLKSQNITYGVIDGSVANSKRTQLVSDYQNGELRTMLIHPKSGAHGLTLTKGTRVVWAAPVYSHSLGYQGNGRIYRNGQTQPTQVITVVADNTIEGLVHQVQTGKRDAQESLLSFLSAHFKGSTL